MTFMNVLGVSFLSIVIVWGGVLQPLRESRRREAYRKRWLNERKRSEEPTVGDDPPRWESLSAVLERHLNLPAELFRPEDTLSLIDELDWGDFEWLQEAGALWGIRSPQQILSRSEAPAGQMTLRTLCERLAAAAVTSG